MDPLVAKVAARYRAARVAHRFIMAGLADQFETKIRDLLDGPLDSQKGKALAAWMSDNFHFKGSKTPKGGKDLKNTLSMLHWALDVGLGQGGNPEVLRPTIESDWSQIQPKLNDLVKLFTEEGGKVVPKEVKVGANTYRNLSGFPEKQLDDYIKALEAVFDELKGWRKKALAGGLEVALAGPGEFRGTSSGKYKSSEDVLYVRATPKILKRSRGTYAAFDYIIVHELGHRYEYKRRPSIDFERQEWFTSPYSQKEGEAFAELFAISNFGIKGSWKQETVDRFENFMTTGKVTEHEPVELPPHLKALVGR